MFRVTILGVLCLLSGSLALAETTAGLHTRNGVTMAPLAVVVTWLGGTMSVPAPDRSVTVRWGHDSLRLSLDSTVAVRNDETVLLERLPALEEQVLYVPLSLLRSAFKVTLTWDATQSTATLTHPQIAKPLVLVLVKTAVELRQELDMAIFQGMLEAVKSIISAHPELLNAKNPQGILPLGQAIAYQQHDIVNYLIAQGVDLKPMLPLQLTYLHLAAAEYDDTALLALLVKKGLAVNATADKGMTPLLAVCCTTQNIDNVRWLLEHGAHPDAALKLSKEELERVNDAQRAVMTAPWFGTALCLAVMYEHPE
ncbi:MAG TPA: ankyrin repeat domain-containing protein, partial [Armatimonadota bacterium]